MTNTILLSNSTLHLAAKIIVVALIGLYVFFTFVQSRQLNLMNKSFQTPARAFFKLVSYGHFLVALGLFLLSLLVL